MLLIALSSVAVSAQETFSDTFSSASYSNNDGTQNWSSNWQEYNDDNNPNNGNIRISGSELYFRRIRSHYIVRSLDLSSYSTATLTFDWRTDSLESGETLVIQISSNGTSFTTLDTFVGTQSGAFNQDITAYISSTTTIRFRKGGNNWSNNNDRAYIDNVTITATSVPATDTDGDGISDAVDLDDDNDGIPDEEEYCSTINTSFLTSSDVGERSVVINHTDQGT